MHILTSPYHACLRNFAAFRNRFAIAFLLGIFSLNVIGAAQAATTTFRRGMTWTVLEQQAGYTHLGADTFTNPYSGDTTIDFFLPILCLRVDGRAAPPGIYFDAYNGWSRGEARLTPAIAATVLTSQAQADYMCSETFGDGWHMAEFHEGRHGSNFSLSGGWTYWVGGVVPSGQRFWVAINDQPANAWNSAGNLPTVMVPKFLPSDAPVPNQYLAMFPETTPASSVDALANELLRVYGGTLIDSFSSSLGFSFNANEAQARAISEDTRVESVDEDSYGQPFVEWHQDRVDQRALPLNSTYAPPNDGSGVNIYILDTGFRRSHSEFGGRARQDADFIRFLGSRDDCNGHGTAVGSAAGGATVGVAPRATLISIRIAGCRGNAYNPLVSVFSSTIVAGLDWVARFHQSPAVANISYGTPPGFWRRWFNLRTPQDRAVRRATNAGVTVVAAAGNDNRNANIYSPARAPEAISVSATDFNDRRASFGNYGKVEIFAPGVSMRLANFDTDISYKSWDGTSLSAPMVAGAAALYLHDNPGASPSQVRDALLAASTSNAVTDPGPGSPNRLLFVGAGARHLGMTWTRMEQRPGYVHVGSDGITNPYSGDTSPQSSLPVLCLLITNASMPSGFIPDYYNGWARGSVAATTPVPGSTLTSKAAADALCAASFGVGWRMAEFHDGRYGTNLSLSGGWTFWAYGQLPAATRFWVSISDQPANPWN